MLKTILESERLIAREFIPSDAPLLVKLNSDAQVMEFTGDEAFVNEAQAQKTIEKRIIAKQYDTYGFGRWAIHLQSNGLFIGWAGLKKSEENGEIDLGIRFHKRFWNKGFGTEISIAILEYGFNTLNLNEIVAYTMPKNLSSQRVLDKSGFTYKGDLQREDDIWKQYSITKK